MGEINHFMHREHSLKFIENLEVVVGISVDNDEKNGVGHCHGCQEPMLGGSGYGCIPCHYFLHKKCVELRPTINHHIHPLHPLTLVDHGDLEWTCDACRKEGQVGGFSYYCIQCDFDACTKCSAAIARKEEALIKFQHEGHPEHTLTLQSRSASFLCDACHSKDEGLLYQCEDCDFWIHKTCTSLAPTINLPHHHKHPLVLVYSLLDNFYKFEYFCEFCDRYILRNGWLYHCANCRYFAHIKCALNAMQPLISSDALGTSVAAEECVNDFPQFPMSCAFTDPLKLLHLENMDLDDDNTTEINHWSHDHPLIFNVESQRNNINNIGCSDPVEVCFGCVRPLSLPYYSCKDGCLFTLHKYCAELALTLEHQLHPDHSLDLVDTYEEEDYYICNGCFSNGNRFVYTCEACKFYLDVNCAFLPNTIKHKSHKHHLVQVIGPDTRCKACYKLFDGISFACKSCKFRLDMFCAL
ncbi:hypothetical protein L6452_31740 [Arctium lappa]|uniref:Uncharacterized protein n=1 Tax=Arctium lappa TaxID=4217 RepID=A0ACB8Z2C3_ARCLA|nr:hypothetical protein L6452_31740 [Arctium lappa]